MDSQLSDSSGAGEADRSALAIDVCICTHRRASLAETVRSIGRLQTRRAVQLRVVIADNDDAPSAKPLVDQLIEQTGLDIAYVHAPAHNISIARNACLDAVRAPLFAFIDDDETAAPEWLDELIATLEAEDAAVVFGPVRAIYRSDAPAWIRAADLHAIRPVEVRAGVISTGYSCNVLLRRDAVAHLRFDPTLGRSGGEDTLFFHQLARSGAKLAFSPAAWTMEEVPAHRARLRWLLSRSFRAGQTHARLLLERRGSRVSGVLLALAKSGYCGLGALATAPWPVRRNAALVRGALHVGVAASLMGLADLQLY